MNNFSVTIIIVSEFQMMWDIAPFLQIQYEITRIRQKMKELAGLHDRHMNRPTLDDSTKEEHGIEITTQEITQVKTHTEFITTK